MHVPHLEDAFRVLLAVRVKRIPSVRLGDICDHPVGKRGKYAADRALLVLGRHAALVVAEESVDEVGDLVA